MPHDNDLSFFLYIKVLKFVFLCEIMKYTLAQPRAPYRVGPHHVHGFRYMCDICVPHTVVIFSRESVFVDAVSDWSAKWKYFS